MKANIRAVSALNPWSVACRADSARRALLLVLLAALLFGFGLHAARACVPAAATAALLGAEHGPCHGNQEFDLAEAACETHCHTEVQSGRLAAAFDLPVAMPLGLAAALAPALPPPVIVAIPPARRDTGPPLHLLLHRLLR